MNSTRGNEGLRANILLDVLVNDVRGLLKYDPPAEANLAIIKPGMS